MYVCIIIVAYGRTLCTGANYCAGAYLIVLVVKTILLMFMQRFVDYKLTT